MNDNYQDGHAIGLLHGRERVGMYVIGEECFAADDAADAQCLTSWEAHRAWRRGYEIGYRNAAEGGE